MDGMRSMEQRRGREFNGKLSPSVFVRFLSPTAYSTQAGLSTQAQTGPPFRTPFSAQTLSSTSIILSGEQFPGQNKASSELTQESTKEPSMILSGEQFPGQNQASPELTQ